MAELKISLGSNEITLSKEDLSRAMFCALVISQEDDVQEVQDKLKEHPHLQFEEIHISVPNLDGDPIQKFVVASAEDTIFVAFQGMVTPTDFIISDLQFDEQLQVNFHKGFFTRSNVFYGGQSPYRHLLLNELLRFKPRVIFCGHSLGGAVSHMVLLRFLLENRQHHPKSDDYFPKCLGSMISIAFGAPPLCDGMAAAVVNENPNFNWRFVNFVNQVDFVPRLLQRYRPDSAELQKFRHDNTTNTEAVNKQRPSGQCTYPNQQGRRGAVINNTGTPRLHDGKAVKSGNYNPDVMSRFSERAKEFASNLRMPTNMSSTATDISAKSRDSITLTTDIKGGVEFHPIGQYIFLNQNGKNDVHHRVDGSSAEISELLKISQFDRASWELHKAARYKEALTGSEDSAQPQPLTTVVKTPLPKVQYANFRSNDEGGSYVKIRGENLLFLSEPVSLNAMPCGDILYRTQNELWVSHPKEFSKKGASRDANYMVSIKTAFGRASRLVTEDFVEESGTTAAVNLLPKIWQCMLVMAQPPLCVLPNTEDLNTLDEIIQCAFEQEVETKLSCRLRWIADGQDPSNHVQDADKFIKDDVLKNFLTSSLWIKYKPNTYTTECVTAVGGLELASTATATGIVAGLASTGTLAGIATGVAVTATLTVMTAGFGVLAGVVIFVALAGAIYKRLKYVRVRNIDSYEEVLDLAIREAKEWKSPQKSDEATMPMEQGINKEHQLKCQVYESDYTFKGMVEKANDSDKTVHQLKAPEFGAATTESMNKFIRRIKMIVKTRPFYERLAKRRFVGILGAEDVGKSTFIKKAILKTVKSEDAGVPHTGLDHHTKTVKSEDAGGPHTGLDHHTETVRPWRFNDSIWLVDFPGGNSTEDYAHQWKFFTALPNIAILFLDFKDDIKKEQKEMYKHLKEDLKTKVLIAFNKVDERYGPRNRSLYVADYFDNQKQKTAKQLNCDVSEIYYVSLDPDISDELFQELKNAGIYDFDQFLEEVIRLCGGATMEPVGEKAR